MQVKGGGVHVCRLDVVGEAEVVCGGASLAFCKSYWSFKLD